MGYTEKRESQRCAANPFLWVHTSVEKMFSYRIWNSENNKTSLREQLTAQSFSTRVISLETNISFLLSQCQCQCQCSCVVQCQIGKKNTKKKNHKFSALTPFFVMKLKLLTLGTFISWLSKYLKKHFIPFCPTQTISRKEKRWRGGFPRQPTQYITPCCDQPTCCWV